MHKYPSHILLVPFIVSVVGCATAPSGSPPEAQPPPGAVAPASEAVRVPLSVPRPPVDVAHVRKTIIQAPFQPAPKSPIPPSRTYNATLEYLKVVNGTGQAGSPELIVLLMSQYLNTNQQSAGIEFYSGVLDRHHNAMAPAQKALYLAALGVLRASYAARVPMTDRVRWVQETVDMLETARQLTNNENFLVRWMIGVVYAQIPDEIFKKHGAAVEDLRWCLDHIDKAPHPGWLREAYFYLGFIHFKAGRDEQADAFLAKSGYDGFDKNVYFTSPYAVNAGKGLTFHPKRFLEIIPGKVFVLSGFEFTEYFFVVSENGKELISIDAGTRPDSAQAAYAFLKDRLPDLPPLTTVFVTHAHWDHIGGHRFFRQLNPEVKFYIRDNYREEFDAVMRLSMVYKYFFGTDFTKEFLADFTPDVTISERRTFQVGETRFELIPIPGGETPDGMFVFMPEEGILFVGDFIMPYIGAPFVEEGNLPGLFEAIDRIVELNPKYLLHGHEPLTRRWNSPGLLSNLKKNLDWLHEETLKAIGDGVDRVTTHHKNLIPPFIDQYPDVQLLYLVTREHVIDRLYDQQLGYWQSGLGGMDSLSPEEFGTLFTHYLKLSESQLREAIEGMLASGDYELAARTVVWSATQFPQSAALGALKHKIFLKLKEKYQEFDPFKFIIYSEQIGHETPQLQ